MAALLALALVVTGLSFAAPSTAQAQETVRRPWMLRDLFVRRERRVEPPMIVEPRVRKKRVVAKSRAAAAAPREPVAPRIDIMEKEPGSKVVLVIGDFLGAGLAEGLNAVYARNPRVRIIDRTNGSSGFVRKDFHDWPREAEALIADEKPAAVVVMLGANDRQQMKVGDTREPARSEAWTREYSARADALAKAIADRKVPLLWVGVPPVKSPKAMADMLAFNETYSRSTQAVGGEFIDIWDGFVDEAGGYVSTGPDISGQPVRLRSSDGISFTFAGKNKVAFYAEKPLNKLLGETNGSGTAAPEIAALPRAEDVPPVDIGSIVRTQPISLQDPELDGGAELMGLIAAPKSDAKSPGEKLLVEGVAHEAKPGRADDFAWPMAVQTGPADIGPAGTALR